MAKTSTILIILFGIVGCLSVGICLYCTLGHPSGKPNIVEEKKYVNDQRYAQMEDEDIIKGNPDDE